MPLLEWQGGGKAGNAFFHSVAREGKRHIQTQLKLRWQAGSRSWAPVQEINMAIQCSKSPMKPGRSIHQMQRM